MRKLLGPLTLAVALVCLVLTGGQAFGASVQCGDTITQDTTLHNDVTGCSTGFGLRVTGDDVTLDLNGHRVAGDGVVGVGLDHGGLTLRNGTVSGFQVGVAIAKAVAYVTRVTATQNGIGFELHHGNAVFERDVATFNLSDGFHAVTSVGDAADATFLRNRADSNGALGINTNTGTGSAKNHAHKNGDPRQCVGVECKP
jgi:hypothetical protein